METIFTKRYKNFVLAALSGMYIFSVIDRQLLAILQEQIKNELHFSDATLGLLSGFTFGIFYTTFGIPIARLSDRYNRKNIISVALLVWSGMTALTGLAQNFIQLFFVRIGVGIGESGGNPAAFSMISEMFPAKKRATALSIYSASASIGILLSYLLGGWIGQLYGWRAAFFLLGLPGAFYALFLYFFVKEPKRGLLNEVNIDEEKIKRLSFKESLRYLIGKKTYVYLCLGYGGILFAFYGANNWMPSFLSRLHQMKSGEIGTWLSLIVGISGFIGYITAGKITDKYTIKNVKYYVWLPALSNIIAIPFSLFVFFGSSKILVLLFLAVPSFLCCTFLGAAIALIHRLVRNDMRAFASAIFLFISNICGVSLGPFVVGILSDRLIPYYGVYSLRWALLITIVASLTAIYFLFKASKHIQSDLNCEIA